jgi:hypothetical protein
VTGPTTEAAQQAALSTFRRHEQNFRVLQRLRGKSILVDQPGPPAIRRQFIATLTPEEQDTLLALNAVVYQPVVTLAEHLNVTP